MKGFTGVTGEPLFLWVFDAADNMAIDTIWQKYNNIRDGKPSSGEFLPDSGKLYIQESSCQIVENFINQEIPCQTVGNFKIEG